ncbi:hypothetical protein [Mucilaginibacter sp. UYCu711]|uniref:hypothetical protein n=1 Tax=Mucilaginibacter sp. UYCu711 TaxID=3156339 RepID=UPI003D21E48C
MLKIKALLICFTAFTLKSFSQDAANAGGKNKEAIIVYKITFSKAGYKMTIADTLFVRNFFVLEPIRVDFENSETSKSTGITKITSSGRKLQWYYFTDLSKMMGMGFNVETQLTRENIKTFTTSSKTLGYGLSAEPFFSNNGYLIDDYIKGKDTIYNGQKCFIIKANRKISFMANSSKEELLLTRMIINPGMRDQNYPFISNVITQHFGGAIMFVESSYQSGMNYTLELAYKPALTPAYRKLFDKYQSLYFANTALLDQLKKTD